MTGSARKRPRLEKAAKTAVLVPFWCPDTSGGASECTTEFQVPAGMRLVIQDVAIISSSANGVTHAGVMYALDSAPGLSVIPPTHAAQGFVWMNKTTPLYADAVQFVGVYGGVEGTQPQVYVTAYLIKK